MTRRLVFAGLLAAVFAVDAAIPLLAIASRSEILKTGRRIELKLAPRDPRDFFRGDYSVLSYEAGELEGAPLVGRDCKASDCKAVFAARSRSEGTLYVLLETGPDGLAVVKGASFDQPADGLFLQGRLRGGASADGLVSRGDPLTRGFRRPQPPQDGGESPPTVCEYDVCVVGTIRYGIEAWYGPQGEPAKLDRVNPSALTARVAVARDGSAVLADVLVDGRPFLDRKD